MCGDSTIETDFDKLMNGQKADMCMTDEPYILDYQSFKQRSIATMQLRKTSYDNTE